MQSDTAYFTGTGAGVNVWKGNVIRMIDLRARFVTTLAGSFNTNSNIAVPSSDGVGTRAFFNGPTGVVLNAAGSIALVVSLNAMNSCNPTYFRYQVWPVQLDTGSGVIRRIDMFSRTVTTIAGTAGSTVHADGVGTRACFVSPNRISLDPTDTFALVASVH